MAKGNILVVDDELEIRRLVSEILEDEGYEVTVAENAEQARAACLERRPDLVLLDIWMPGTDGIELLKEWAEAGQLPFRVVMMSGHGTIETAVEATRQGAYDFLEKPLSLAKLLLTAERSIESIRLERENQRLRDQNISVEAPLGNSEQMRALRAQAITISQHDSPVLIKGEAGSGKETIARFIHESGPRKDSPFVTLRIGAVASGNSQAAIFGREQDGQVYYGHL
jgi:DNA-binding NtrC family response regulator